MPRHLNLPTCLPFPPPHQQPAYQAVPGRLIIKMDPNYVSAMDTDSQGLRFARPAGPRGAAVYTITDGKTVAQKLAEMADNPGETDCWTASRDQQAAWLHPACSGSQLAHCPHASTPHLFCPSPPNLVPPHLPR